MKIRFIQNMLDKIKGKKELFPKQKISFLVFWVGTKCTLKCKLCCNLIPYSEQISYNADEILKDLKIVVRNSKIKALQIQGGEPFTHPEIIKILDFVSKLKVKRIDLATNGTVKLSDDVLKALKRNPKIRVRISNYDCTKKLRENFCKTLDENKIPYDLYDFYLHDNSWFSTGGINEQRASDEKVKEIYQQCKDKSCQTLADGILTICGKVPVIKEIYQDYSSKKNDEINVRKIRKSLNPLKNMILRKKISKFYSNKKIYKEQCRYCNISNDKHPAAEQISAEELKISKRQIEYAKKNK